ncbi:hypothetical protein Z968_03015 [Clostridium novyi A str. 4552]|uniref:Alpha-L-glutamate ligase-related protein ATP-grasp domain-containing protein n=1 Tax=Clostridium novyi A str. 4552 TaxID=1444289 RepID=A0A0A0IAY7_CLONO|nr:sugar-transfer associated ATP-grasp domain-containing protein [Clostridium novyi]KGM97506.1 hypothetical protein Z968_03015 [Clostridium novyi A str. 4552]
MSFSNFKKTFIGIKLRELRYRYIYKNTDTGIKRALERYKKCTNKKPMKQIKKEIALCKKYWGFYPFHYFRYNLYKKDKDLKQKDLLNYVPEFYFYNLLINENYNKKYSVLLSDKNLTEDLFRSRNIKQPETIGKVVGGNLYDNCWNSLGFNEFIEKLIIRKPNKIFIKPANGYGGSGIYIFNREKDYFINKAGDILDEKFLTDISIKSDYIIQCGLKQQEHISRIYDKSINTFRIATENIKGKVRVVCATLRFGKDGKEVDNSGQNGIILGIDELNGKCKEFAITEQEDIYYKHPDSGFEFKNINLKQWDDLKKFAEESARKLPEFTYIGWDIALTDEGPIAIEANLEFGLDHFQVTLGGVKEKFRIKI